MTAQWIPTGKKNTYRCSNCGKELTTSYPPSYWPECPWCHATMLEKEDAGDGSENE